MRPTAAAAARLLALLACLAQLHSVAASGVFELQILEFTNYRLQLASGACCGGARPAGAADSAVCGSPCRTRFALCLKEYQSAAAPGACSFGRAASPALGTDSFTLAEPLYTLALPFTFRWTRSFTLILQAYDDYNYTDPENSGLIAEVWWSGIVEPGAAWHALRGEARAAAAAYRVRVLCQPNYYNSTCTTFCRARDDQFGHYTCSPAGDKRCLPGWRGDNCDIPVCKEGCHPVHGRCDRPGDCDCRPGWRGELCAQCTPYPGCKHGYCNGSSWDCTCDTNWGGILCDQDLNYCGTHEPCQHGGTCENTAPDQYLCTCAEGFSGANCERVDHPCAPRPCRHGSCRLAPSAAAGAASPPAASTPSVATDAAPDPPASQPGFVCDCSPGWAGPLCDQDVDECASSPCLHGATCRDLVDGYECECAPGWSGPVCVDDVDECADGLGPCVNAAACVNAPGGFSCTCLAGWAGTTCAANVDDCAGQCLNGATCIDLVNDYHCACAAGYAGRTCARDVDECAPRPCMHGGECVDLLNAYRCICPVGFSGFNCEDDRDHCASAPCGNGAACYTAQSDYYCHCPRGWTGKNCTMAAAAAAPTRGCPPCRRGRCVRGRCVCEPGYGGAACADRVECSAAEGEAACGAGGTCVAGTCVCLAGWTGPQCEIEVDECSSAPCRNNATCVDGVADFACLCADGWTGKTCDTPAAQISWCGEGTCLNGGSCAAGAGGEWACACRSGWAGARCERAADACAAQPCLRGGRCVPRAGWYTCECPAGWAGARCEEPAAPAAPAVPAACAACPRAAVCALDAQRGSHRCLCPPPASRSSRRCLELVAGLGDNSEEDSEGEERVEDEADVESVWGEEGAAGGGRACSGDNGTWWWGCNTCWCSRGAAQCTRLWCGLADCLAAGAAACRADEVCVPAAPALCLRAPCAAPGECRRVSGRRVEPPPLPAPPACWPAAAAAPPEGCARARLELARERLGRGAHVERACSALRRALAVQLVPRTTPLALLCDLASDDEDALDVALWVGPEEGAEGAATLAAAVRALAELVSRRRLAAHPLLGAALRLRLAPPAPAAREPPPASAPSPLVPLLASAAVVSALCVVAAILYRRRRAVAADRRRRDEDKSNNLQNEENLRRYANPLRDEPEGGAGGAGGAAGAGELPRALYKAQNADARNNAPPRPADKECTKRALQPPEPPPARRPAPPERLTVLV